MNRPKSCLLRMAKLEKADAIMFLRAIKNVQM